MPVRTVPHASNAFSNREIVIPRTLICAAVIATVLFSPAMTVAQLPQADLEAVFPPGGQAGTSVQMSAIGNDLDQALQATFTHPGIVANVRTADVEGILSPVPGEFDVAIAADVPPGVYEVRVIGKHGGSNPRAFVVSARTEALEKEPNNDPAAPQALTADVVVNGRSDGGTDVDWYSFAAEAGQTFIIDCWAKRIDSRMSPYLELHGPSGRRVRTARNTHRGDAVISYTVPEAGQYRVRVSDDTYQGGRDYVYRLLIHHGPHIDHVWPASAPAGSSAELTLFGWNLPGGTSAELPAEGSAGLQKVAATVQMRGDLQALGGELLAVNESGYDAQPFALQTAAGPSNPVTIFAATAPVITETESGNDQPQSVKLPVEVTGRFGSRGDIDSYEFTAAAGEEIWVETFGQRSGSLADPVLTIERIDRDDKGNATPVRIARIDDEPDNNVFISRGDDASFKFTPSVESTYRVSVRDRYYQNRGAAGLTYRLLMTARNPDFRLVAVPRFSTLDGNQLNRQSELTIRRGDSTLLTVMAVLKQGFTEPIDISVTGLPPGVTATSATLFPGQTAVPLILRSSETTPQWNGPIQVVGKAMVDAPAAIKDVVATQAAVAELNKKIAAVMAKGEPTAAEEIAALNQQLAAAQSALQAAEQRRRETKTEIVRAARSATTLRGGNPGIGQLPVSRVGQSLQLSVLDELAPWQILANSLNLRVRPGQQLLLPVAAVRRNGFEAPIAITFQNQPGQIQVENKPFANTDKELIFRFYVQQDLPPGRAYPFMALAQAQVSYASDPETLAAAQQLRTIAEQQLATVTAEVQKIEQSKAATDQQLAEKNAAVTAAQAASTQAEEGLKAAVATLEQSEQNLQKAATEVEAATRLADRSRLTATLATAAVERVQVRHKRYEQRAAAVQASLNQVPGDQVLTAELNLLNRLMSSSSQLLQKQQAELQAATTALTQSAATLDQLKAAQLAAEQAVATATETVVQAQMLATKAARVLPQSTAAAQRAMKNATDVAEALNESKAALAAATAAKAAADQAVQAAQAKGNATGRDVVRPAIPVILDVLPAPVTVAAAPDAGGNIKRSGTLNVTVNINRVNGFAGPVTASIPNPPNVAGLTCNPVTIAADQTSCVLTLQAAGDAVTGQMPNMVVRTVSEFNGEAIVEVPITIAVGE